MTLVAIDELVYNHQDVESWWKEFRKVLSEYGVHIFCHNITGLEIEEDEEIFRISYYDDVLERETSLCIPLSVITSDKPSLMAKELNKDRKLNSLNSELATLEALLKQHERELAEISLKIKNTKQKIKDMYTTTKTTIKVPK